MTSVYPSQPSGPSSVSNPPLLALCHPHHVVLRYSFPVATRLRLGCSPKPTHNFSRRCRCFRPCGSILAGPSCSWGGWCALGLFPGTAWSGNVRQVSRRATHKYVVQHVVMWFDWRRGREGVLSDRGHLWRPVASQRLTTGKVRGGHIFPDAKG